MNGYGVVKVHLTNSPHKWKEGREFLSLYLLPHSKAILGGTILNFLNMFCEHGTTPTLPKKKIYSQDASYIRPLAATEQISLSQKSSS